MRAAALLTLIAVQLVLVAWLVGAVLDAAAKVIP